MRSPVKLSRFRPCLIDALRGYGRKRFFRDLGAGATVGIVALPLAMAFTIASGLKPEAGIWTAIIAGFLISGLGGSAVQIGGPAGAFIVIVYGVVERYGLPNLLIATACAGVLLFLLGLAIDRMPADVFSHLHQLGTHLGTVNLHAFGLGLVCLADLFVWPLLLRDESRMGHAVRRVWRISPAVSHGMTRTRN